jgi:hypothetical protein
LKKAQKEEEKTGDPAYWIWKGILMKELPVKYEKIINNENIKNVQ